MKIIRLFFILFLILTFILVNMISAAGATGPNPLGIIYSKSSWTNTADFITHGNTTAVLSGTNVNISSSTQDDWNNIIDITGYRTKLEKWRFRLRFRIITWSGSSYGLGFGLKSANQYVQNDVMGFIQTTNSGAGGLYILKSGRTIMASGSSALGVALNNVIELEGDFHDSVFHFTAHNITSGNTASASFTYATNGSTLVVPNASNFSLMELGGTHQVQSIEISSEELTGGNIVTIGDSKTIGYFSNSFAGRYAAQLNNVYPSVVINAGGADRVTHVLNRQQELTMLAPSKYLLCIGSNDLRFGSTLTDLQHNYDSLVQILLATGATVYHFVLPEDYTKSLGVNTVPLRDWVAATYPAYYINVWDSMASGNFLKGIYDTGDGVHINQAGNDKIYQALVASNKLEGSVLAVRLLSFTGNRLSRNKGKIEWKLDPFQQADTYVILKSRDGVHYSEIGMMPSNNNASYTYFDYNLQPGMNYYKLSMIENRSDTVESNVLAINNAQQGILFYGWQQLQPGQFLFSFNSTLTVPASYSVTDMNGRTVCSGRQLLKPGQNEVKIELYPYHKGVYYFKLLTDSNGEQYIQPFLY